MQSSVAMKPLSLDSTELQVGGDSLQVGGDSLQVGGDSLHCACSGKRECRHIWMEGKRERKREREREREREKRILYG